MPVSYPEYIPPFIFRNGHISTIYSALARKVRGVVYQRQRIELPDGDFLDLDWSLAKASNRILALVLHGLEGDSHRPYVLGAVKKLNVHGFDALAVNFRGCSGEPNQLFRGYHGGNTEDLSAVIDAAKAKGYRKMVLIGFSLGGNILLKYLGTSGMSDHQVVGGIAISTPCALRASLEQLNLPINFVYRQKFLRQLRRKLAVKFRQFPEAFPNKLPKIHSLLDFDNFYTGPAHGFKDAFDYYEKCSSIQFLKHIQKPVLILNAQNDSFLKDKCYPVAAAQTNPYIHLSMPKYGGHVGFYQASEFYFHENEMIAFLHKITSDIDL
jgi:predicted alpha/beta-fold hydrolase